MNLTEQMAATLIRWDETGLSLRAFAARDGHSYAKLTYWRGKLRGPGKPRRRRASEPRAESPKIVPVHVVPDAIPSGIAPKPFEVWLTNGVSIDVHMGFDDQELQRLARALSEC